MLLTIHISWSQSIRKDFHEMTVSEKDAFVDALYAVRQGPDVFADLANFHANNFSSIHFNSPSQDVFLAWHRRQILELEQALQEDNPRVSIPLWNWVTDNSSSDPMWNHSFLGQFVSAFGISRPFSNGVNLPTQSEINNVQAITNWDNYVSTLENGSVHVGGHVWIGGTMASGNSPADPVFYMHHGMIDKLWQDWVVANNITPSSNLYIKTDMPRYDGTYSFNGQVLPSVNPDDIVDSRDLGVFYAANGLAVLDEYSVQNEYQNREHFYYQYKIEVEDFDVPNGKAATIESVNEIVIKPGFVAEDGSSFIAKIDQDNDAATSARITTALSFDQNFDSDNKNVYENNGLTHLEMTLLPNPVVNDLQLSLKEMKDAYDVEVLDYMGNVVIQEEGITSPITNLNLSTAPNGMLLVKIKQKGQILAIEKIIKK